MPEVAISEFEQSHTWRQWRVASLQTRIKLDISPGYKPLAMDKFSFQDIKPCQERIRDVLEIACASIPSHLRKQTMKDGFFVDVSQCVSRKKWGSGVKTLCTGTMLYDLGNARVCTSNQHLALQGLPSELSFAGISESKKRELAGEAMFLPSMATVLLAVVLNRESPWWEQTTSSAKKARTA
jgi:hypothetical protein